MAWACRNNGWIKDSKEVTGIKTSRGGWWGRKGRPTLRWMDDIELNWRYMGVKR
jgi:hypothetical protein